MYPQTDNPIEKSCAYTNWNVNFQYSSLFWVLVAYSFYISSARDLTITLQF